MSKIVRRPLTLTAFALSLASSFAALPALAQDAPPPGFAHAQEHAHEQCPHRDGRGDPAQHIEKRLDRLGEQLHLKDSQQAAWTQYRTQVTALTQAHQKTREAEFAQRKPHEQSKAPTAPERLQKAAERARTSADHLDKLAKQTAAFYKTLTPEQQTIFDLTARDHGKHGHFDAGMKRG